MQRDRFTFAPYDLASSTITHDREHNHGIEEIEEG